MTRPACIPDPSDTPQIVFRQRRGMTREEAAAYCGCESMAAFSDWVRRRYRPRSTSWNQTVGPKSY